jgi:hypothetical protein
MHAGRRRATCGALGSGRPGRWSSLVDPAPALELDPVQESWEPGWDPRQVPYDRHPEGRTPGSPFGLAPAENCAYRTMSFAVTLAPALSWGLVVLCRPAMKTGTRPPQNRRLAVHRSHSLAVSGHKDDTRKEEESCNTCCSSTRGPHRRTLRMVGRRERIALSRHEGALRGATNRRSRTGESVRPRMVNPTSPERPNDRKERQAVVQFGGFGPTGGRCIGIGYILLPERPPPECATSNSRRDAPVRRQAARGGPRAPGSARRILIREAESRAVADEVQPPFGEDLSDAMRVAGDAGRGSGGAVRAVGGSGCRAHGCLHGSRSHGPGRIRACGSQKLARPHKEQLLRMTTDAQVGVSPRE